jgi:hypothetical protein
MGKKQEKKINTKNQEEAQKCQSWMEINKQDRQSLTSLSLFCKFF